MRPEHIVSVDPLKCTLCGSCCDDCPDKVLFLGEKSAEHNGHFCVKCGHCVAICPQGAASISGFDDEPEEIRADKKVDSTALLAQIKSRRSMRRFTDEDVAPELITQIIEAGRYTPTGGNKQGTSFVVIRDKKDEYEKITVDLLRKLQPQLSLKLPYLKEKVIEDGSIFKGAPVAVLVKSIDALDGALAASTMELFAQSLGLGVLYSGFFSRMVRASRKLKKELAVEPGEKVVTTLVIGYPAVKYLRTAQRETARVVYR